MTERFNFQENDEDDSAEETRQESLNRLVGLQESIERVKERFIGIEIPSIGIIESISPSDLGETISLDIKAYGGVSKVIIASPMGKNQSLVKKGNIGLELNGEIVDISEVSLSGGAVMAIQDIYQQYTGEESNHNFKTESK